MGGGGGGGSVGGGRGRGQGGCERRIEVLVNFKKKKKFGGVVGGRGGSVLGWGVRVDVNEVGGGVGGGVRVDVNEELKVL